MVDSDGDGCSDAEETAPEGDPSLGGDRDPSSPWDFFDVPAPALTAANPSSTRNKAVTLADVQAVLFYVGARDNLGPNGNGVDYDSDLNADGVEDGQAYDRTPSADGAKPWRSSAPNGAVSLQDAQVALAQVGHSCVAPP